MRSIARAERSTADRWAARGLATALALLVCFPLLGPGYTLSYDMVFVPDPVLNERALGLDGSVPRAVPMDFLLGLLGQAIPMPLVQQAVLLFCIGGAALGMWRLSPAATIPGAAAAATAYSWSAYTAERLVMGHWSLLLGVALLPWMVSACLREAQSRDRTPWRVVVLTGAAAAAAPTVGVLAGLLVVALVWVLPLSRSRRWIVTWSIGLFNAVWILPGLRAASGLDRTTSGVTAFALSSDTPLGPLVAALTGGGAWNHLVHPTSRTATPVSALIGLGILAVAGYGVWSLLRAGGALPRRALTVLIMLGLCGLLLAAGSATATGQEVLGRVVLDVPGAGILRDAQKWLAWWLLVVAVGLGPGLERLVRAFPPGQAAFVTGCAALLPVVILPDMAGGVDGRLDRVVWPAEYAEVADVLNSRPDDGALLVLPWHAFRAWPWAGNRTTLDPWPRMVARDVVVRDDLELPDGIVPGEDPTAAAVGRLLADGDAGPAQLRELGVRYVVTDRSTAGGPAPSWPGERLHDGPDLELVDLGPVPGDGSGGIAIDVLAADLLAGSWWLVAVGAAFRARPTRLLP